MFKNSVTFSPHSQIAIVIFLCVSLVTANPGFTFLALLYVPLSAKLLWKKNEPPVLFLGFLFQWLQIVIKVFFADIVDVPFESVTSYPANINASFLLCLTALFIQAVGVYLVINNFSSPSSTYLYKVINKYNRARITLLYIGFSLLTSILLNYSPGGLAQFTYKLSDFKWAIFFLFYCITFMRGQKTYTFYIIISIEIILGFTGYFSGFKDFFLFVAICYLTIRSRLTILQYVSLGTAAIAVFSIMIIWQTVKSDYRNYLNGGQRAQIVTVSKTQALSVLYFKVSTLDKEDFTIGMRALVDRISYIAFFSQVMNYVPAHLDYEHGKLWTDAVTRIFMPRIFFPNKSVIYDSEKTRKYTGNSYAGATEGASISIGYITESYVDFGPFWMFFPLLLFGMLIGWIYKFIITRSYSVALGYACSVPLFFQLYTFELALDKAIGALISFFLVYLIVRRFLLVPTMRYIQSRPE